MAAKVMVVDDDPLTQRVLRHYLERAGYHVISASSGREVVELAKRELPQLILLDMMLPGIDGSTVLEQLYKAEETAKIPVVRLSGNLELLAQVEQSGQNLVLTKPIKPEQLLMAIKRFIPETPMTTVTPGSEPFR